MPGIAQHEIEAQLRRMTPVSAPAEQHEELVALLRLLERFARARERGATACRVVGAEEESLPIPDTVLLALQRVVDLLSRGDAISVVSIGTELTTEQAANLLNVSRQYLVRLLDEGRIPFARAGKHRRILVDDVLAFKRNRDRARRTALDRLTRLSEDLGGYSELG